MAAALKCAVWLLSAVLLVHCTYSAPVLDQEYTAPQHPVKFAAALIALNSWNENTNIDGVTHHELAAFKSFRKDVREGAPAMYDTALKLDSMPADEITALLQLPADSQPVKLVTKKWSDFGAKLKSAAAKGLESRATGTAAGYVKATKAVQERMEAKLLIKMMEAKPKALWKMKKEKDSKERTSKEVTKAVQEKELPAHSQSVKLVTEKWKPVHNLIKHAGKIIGTAAGRAKKWMGGGGQSEAASGGYGYNNGLHHELVQEQTEEDDDHVQLAAALIALSGSYVKPSDMSATELAAFTSFQNDVKEQAPGMYAAAMKLDSMPAEEVTALLQLPADSQSVKLVTEKWKDVRKYMKHAADLAKKWMGGGGQSEAASGGYGDGGNGGWKENTHAFRL